MKALWIVLVLACMVMAGCGTKVDQDIRVDDISSFGECSYTVQTTIRVNGTSKYYNWVYGVPSDCIEETKVYERNKAQRIIDSGCLKEAQ